MTVCCWATAFSFLAYWIFLRRSVEPTVSLGIVGSEFKDLMIHASDNSVILVIEVRFGL